jgi:NADPH:quinone reductase-like Zn-dependent oxidoreductase
MASFGRFIEIGKRDIEASKLLDMSKFRRNVTFAAVDLVDLFLYKGPRMHHLLKNVMELIESAKVSPVAPINSFPASEIQKAFRYMQSGKHMGKIVITTNPSDKVQVSTEIRGRHCTST